MLESNVVEESAATDAEAKIVELDAEGKQVGPGSRGGHQEALEKMQGMKKGGRAKWWQHLQPVLVSCTRVSRSVFSSAQQGRGVVASSCASATQQQQHLTT